MIKLFARGQELKLDFMQFPAGERHVRISGNIRRGFSEEVESCRIECNLTSSNDIMDLFLLTDAARRKFPYAKVCLLCKYFPYARQDRVAIYGEPLSVAVMAKLINSQNYYMVEIWDAHSDVTKALIDRLVHIDVTTFARRLLSGRYPEVTHSTIIIPDAGATKRVSEIARANNSPFVQADKIRNPVTGEITGTVVHGVNSLNAECMLIIDDICDGGRTFTEIARVIHKEATTISGNSPKIYLYVTHGIFTKGIEPLIEAGIEHIYTANYMREGIPPSEFVTVI